MQKILSKILLINECVESLDFERLPSLHIDNNWWESQSRVLVAKVLWAANNFWISVFALSLPDNDWSIFINLLFFSCSCWWTSLAELSHGLQRVREEMNKRLITAQRVKALKWREGPTLYIFPSYQITAFILTRSIMRTKAKLILSWALRKRILVVNENSQLTKVPPVCADDVGVHAEHLQPARHLRLLLHAGLEPLAQRHLAIFLL